MKNFNQRIYSCLKGFSNFLNINKRWLVIISAIFCLNLFAKSVYADYNRYLPGEQVTLGEFVYDDNYQPSNANCSTTVFNPSGTLVVDDVLLTSVASGWHYHTFTPASIEGLWSASIYCGSSSTGDLIKTDKSFIVAFNRLSDKTLAGGGSIATESYVDVATATIKSGLDFNNSLITSLNNISAADVWSFAGRDLDRPTIVTASTSRAIWEIATSSLTSAGTIGKLIADNLDSKVSAAGGGSLTAADVWTAANRTLTDYATSSITQAVWGNANRTLSNYGNDITAADVWNVLSASLVVNNSIGKQLADNADAKVSSVADSVWLSGTRTLTDYSTSSIATAVWNNPTRSLTSFGTLVADIWSDLTAPTRQLTSGALTGGGILATESYLSASANSVTSSIINEVLQNRTLINNLNNISATDVWSYVGRDLDRPTIVTASTSAAVWAMATSSLNNLGSIGKMLVDNLDVKVSTRGTSLLTAADVWDAANRTLTDYQTSSIALSVWNNAARTLTNYGNDITAADVWSVLTSTLNLVGTIGKQLAENSDIRSSAINTEVLQNRTLINNLNNISALDVWSYVGRDLDNPVRVTASTTAAIWATATSSLTNSGSIGKLIADNLDAKVSTVGGGSLTAADIWTAANRTLTDYQTSSMALAVWGNSARTLTNYGNNITALDVWNVLTSSLNTAGSIGRQLAENTDIKASAISAEVLQNRTLINNLNNISATDVWSYVGRDLDNPVRVTASTTAAIWASATSSLTNSGSIGKLIADNLDAKVSTVGGGSLTAADIWTAANRTLTDYQTSTMSQAIWANAARTLTNYGNDITAVDVWNVLTSTLNTAGSIGRQLSENTDIRSSVLNTEILQNRTLINNLNNISATDVWSFVGRDLDNPVIVSASTSNAIWNKASASLTGTGTIGKLIVDNLDDKISSRGTSTLTAADVWSAATRTLTDYQTSNISLAVWANAARTLTSYGNDITAADVWSVLTSTLNIAGSVGRQLVENTDLRASTLNTEILQNRTLINNLNNISATDVWSFVGRDLDSPVRVTASTTAAIWAVATSSLTNSGSVGKLIADNLDLKVSAAGGGSLTAADIWSAANRTLTDYSTSSISLAVWANAARTLTNYGNNITAADVWNVLTSTLTTVNTIGNQLTSNIDLAMSTRASLSAQQAGWTVRMSDATSISAGKTYRAKLYVLNNEYIPTDANSTPTITVYDADRNVVVSAVAMSRLANGIYEYTYSVANLAVSGLWESVISTEVTPGKVVQTNDFWIVGASPAQVIINSVYDTTAPEIIANATITNEGLSGYEYHYEWCVVTSANNACGGGNDIFYASAAKFINPGDDWNTDLSATVPANGDYFFKLVVYFGTEQSGASRTFTVDGGTTPPVVVPPTGGGGGGGGGGTIPPSTTSTLPVLTCNGADFNHDKSVNSIDFSILLAFWKTLPPFRNPCVDINKDKNVNSVDFSILMYEWGSKK